MATASAAEFGEGELPSSPSFSMSPCSMASAVGCAGSRFQVRFVRSLWLSHSLFPAAAMGGPLASPRNGAIRVKRATPKRKAAS